MNPLTATYLNRLSDLLFVLARYANREAGDVALGARRQPLTTRPASRALPHRTAVRPLGRRTQDGARGRDAGR